jgi:hypothetical protein
MGDQGEFAFGVASARKREGAKICGSRRGKHRRQVARIAACRCCGRPMRRRGSLARGWAPWPLRIDRACPRLRPARPADGGRQRRRSVPCRAAVPRRPAPQGCRCRPPSKSRRRVVPPVRDGSIGREGGRELSISISFALRGMHAWVSDPGRRRHPDVTWRRPQLSVPRRPARGPDTGPPGQRSPNSPSRLMYS